MTELIILQKNLIIKFHLKMYLSTKKKKKIGENTLHNNVINFHCFFFILSHINYLIRKMLLKIKFFFYLNTINTVQWLVQKFFLSNLQTIYTRLI